MFLLDNVLILVTGFAVTLAVFLVLREFWCWYFKINAHLANQQKIIRLMESQDLHITDVKDLLHRKNNAKRPSDPPVTP